MVHDVSVLGGSADVFGTVTGDLAVMGGSFRVREGARVMGDASTVGGDVRRGPKAVVGGEVAEVGDGRRSGRGGRDEGRSGGDERQGGLARLASDASGAITRTALLFVFGAVLLALGTRRMEMLKLEIASRPMRSFAMGIVGSIAAVLLLIVLCVTVIGIPFAAVGFILALFAVVAGMCSVLETVGNVLLGHRTKNAYAHLALGCGLLLVLGAIPFVGGLLKAAVVLVGIGSVVSTRAAGLLRKKNGGAPLSGPHPYRDQALD